MGQSHPNSAALPEPIEVAWLVAHELEALGVAYFIGGSLASAVHGVTRATLDVDLIADLDESHVERLAHALQGHFYVDPEAMREAIRHRRSFNLIHLATMFKVDVFVSKGSAYAAEQFRRRMAEEVGREPGQTVYLASPEDIVLAKLDWYRMGGNVSARQWQDVLGVLRVQAGKLDWAYLHDWAGALGLAELLERARQESGQAEGSLEG